MLAKVQEDVGDAVSDLRRCPEGPGVIPMRPDASAMCPRVVEGAGAPSCEALNTRASAREESASTIR